MNVSLRPLEDRDLDTIYQQVTDPESVRMAAFTAEDQTDRRVGWGWVLPRWELVHCHPSLDGAL
jgi:hypothetical protein